tara:strand:+ start:649 stop:1023 length:375 start_codon:yes stop_codon:yes gene_type:complete
LNTTARKGEKQVEKASPYLINSTYSVIIAELARPIGPFDLDAELAMHKRQQSILSGKETTDGEKQLEESKDAVLSAGEEDEKNKTMTQSLNADVLSQGEVWNENDAIFERMVIIIPYKSPDLVK